MDKKLTFSIVAAAVLIGGSFYIKDRQGGTALPAPIIHDALAAKFEMLSQNGNSSCSGGFRDSIDAMPGGARLQGSCCSPMDFHRYEEQVTGLTKFKDIPEIPPDPYDIDAALAKQLKAYYETPLTSE
jgi:hypothetical protein